MTPRQDAAPSSDSHPVPLELPLGSRIAAAIDRFGEADTIDRAFELLAGANAGDEFLLFVGGEHARGVLDGAPPLYWPELWGARTLLYVWSEKAVPAVVAGLSNQAWRVREMSVRVALERRLDVAETLVELTADTSPRVRAAAVRALGSLGTADHADRIIALVRDADRDVRRAAQEARDTLRERHPSDTTGGHRTDAVESPADPALPSTDAETNAEAAHPTE